MSSKPEDAQRVLVEFGRLVACLLWGDLMAHGSAGGSCKIESALSKTVSCFWVNQAWQGMIAHSGVICTGLPCRGPALAERQTCRSLSVARQLVPNKL